MSDLVARLNDIWRDGDHDRGCQGRSYSCTCGYDEQTIATAKEAATELQRLSSENSKLKKEAANPEGLPEDVLRLAADCWATLPKEGAGIMHIAKAIAAAREGTGRRLNNSREAKEPEIGEWVVKENGDGYGVHPVKEGMPEGAGSAAICTVHGYYDEAEDHAFLIAAAPDLLEALCDVVDWHGIRSRGELLHRDAQPPEIAKAMDAISKAEIG